MAFKVNFTQLQSKASAIVNDFETLELAKTEASNAGAAAVSATGGEATPVGKAIKEAIQDDTVNEFNQAKIVINDMIDALGKVSKVYENENNELLSKIKSIAAQAAENSNTIGNDGSSSSI